MNRRKQRLRGHLSHRYPPPYTVALVVVSMVAVLAAAAIALLHFITR